MGTISSEKLQAGGAVSFSPDGRFLISTHMILKNLKTEMWDTAAGTLVRGSSDASLRDEAARSDDSKGLAQLAYEKGMYILTAAQSYQAAQETSQLGHGLLTTRLSRKD